MMAGQSHDRPITIAMLALGGQGGGVLTKWLVDVAEANGFVAQSTYVAGVAQRTGSTVYCVEMMSRDALDGRRPVFTPYPVPGDVELVLAGELAESGRAIQKGFVTPNATTLIASSHRVYSIAEKEALDDGIVDQQPVVDIANKVARQFICFDMEKAATESGSIISAVMLGAIAASGVLPFDRLAYEQVIRVSGRAVDANLAGFAAGYSGAGTEPEIDHGSSADYDTPEGEHGRSLEIRIADRFPEALRGLVLHGALRALDYQDQAYASLYVDRVGSVFDAEHQRHKGRHQYAVTTEVARQLALQMCYEDTIRVAELKTRGERSRRVREQLGARDRQVVHVIEYFHPRIEEICDMLPRRLGAWLLRCATCRKLLTPIFSKGRNIATTSISGFVMLRMIAGMRRWRRSSYRYGNQWQHIGAWLARIDVALTKNYDDALMVARAVEAVRGYGDTYERGVQRYRGALENLG